MISQLIHILHKEAELFAEFLELLEQQQKMLLTGDISGLTSVTEHQQYRLADCIHLSRERETLVAQLRTEYAITGDMSLSKLLDVVDDHHAAQLKTLRDTILDLNAKITETRNANAMLLNQSRDFIARTMKALAEINSPSSAYVKTGQKSEWGGSAMMDRRA